MFESFKKEIKKNIINLTSNAIVSSAEAIKDEDEVSQVHDPLPKKPDRRRVMKKLNDLIDKSKDELENNHD